MKLTANQLIRLEFVEDNDMTTFECVSCGDTISSEDLVTPCHPTTGFAEGSGHGGVDGMAIYCALNEPTEIDGELTSYCGWGGPIKSHFPQLVCSHCLKSPFLSRPQYDYSGKCPICDTPFIEGEFDDGVVDATEPWADGYGECCQGTPEAEAISKAIAESMGE